MGVQIQEVVGTVQRTPEARAEAAGRVLRAEPAALPEEIIRAFLEREERIAARAKAD